jgi:phospholipid-binding lipoprotein MlaA
VPFNNDPLEKGNRSVYAFNEALDKHVLTPVAEKYVAYVPQTIRTGVSHFFTNLSTIDVILNDILQAKFRQGVSDIGRFTTNTTVGIGGLFDPATAWGLPQHNEDFGQTLAVWGVGDGAFVELPLFGPSTVRDATGLVTRTLLNPFTYLTLGASIPAGAVGVTDSRANLLSATKIRDEAAVDKYAFTREVYRQKRRNEIFDGNPPDAVEYSDVDVKPEENYHNP